MRCPSCDKKVIFGSISGEAWRRVHSGQWLYGTVPPKPGALGDCPSCGVRLVWEPGEQAGESGRPAVARVHLFALREAPGRWSGQDVALRAILVVHGGEAWLSDSWRSRGKEEESDRKLLERLSREQVPRLGVTFLAEEVRSQFRESARKLEGGMAAWVEMEGLFRDGTLAVKAITSIWPPRD